MLYEINLHNKIYELCSLHLVDTIKINTETYTTCLCYSIQETRDFNWLMKQLKSTQIDCFWKRLKNSQVTKILLHLVQQNELFDCFQSINDIRNYFTVTEWKETKK